MGNILDKDHRLEHCVKAGNIRGAQRALRRGASVDTISSYTLAKVGYQMVQLLIEEGIHIGKIDGALWPAMECHNFKVAKLLLENGAKPNAQDSFLLLHHMCTSQYQHSTAVKILLEYMADPDLRDASGQTPLLHAIRYDVCDIQTIKLLLQFGAQTDLLDNSGNTALGIAISNGRSNEAMLLIKYGADINLKDEAGMTPLMKAVNYYDGFWDDDPILDLKYIQRKAYILTNLLLENGAMTGIQNKNKRTALMLACLNKDTNTVRLLLSYGASVNLQDKRQRSALMYASKLGDKASVRLLLECGADADMLDRRGHTALNLARMNGNESVAAILLKHKAV